MKLLVGAFVLMGACSGDGSGVGVDAPAHHDDAAIDGAGSGSGSGSQLHSTLTATCTTLQGRAIVHENGNLGVVFTASDVPYTFLGSVQFELDAGYTGAIPDPEMWDGSSSRRVVAVTSPSYELFGNHCWPSGQPPVSGSVVVQSFAPTTGIVKATFSALALHSCTGGAVCTVSGMIETTAQGVFD